MDAEGWNAIATAASTVVALGLGGYGVMRDRGDRVVAQTQRRASLARAVDLWTVSVDGAAVICIRNGGAQAITHVLVPDEGAPRQELIARGKDPDRVRTRTFLGTVLPGEVMSRRYGAFSNLEQPFSIEFRDAHGVLWSRSSDGSLTEIV